MAKQLSRREMLKLMAAGSAAVAGAPLMHALGEGLSAPPAQDAVEITYWQAPIWRLGKDVKTVLGPGSDEWILDAIARFEADNPGIKVNMELIPWDQWGQKITTAFASGDLPNVLYGNLSADRVQAGLFEPVDDYVTQEMVDDWLPGIRESLVMLGRLYAVPAFPSADMVALSKTALENHGGAGIFEAIGENRGGLTFDVMKEYGAEFSDGSTRYFFGVPTDHGSVIYWMFGAWLNGWGVKSWSDDEEKWIVAENENAVAAFQWLVDAQSDGILIPNLPKWSDVDTFYWSQNCAMRYHWPSIEVELAVAQEAGQAETPFEIVLAAYPHTEEVGPFHTNSVPGHYTICREPDTAKREAAFRWAYWLGNDTSNTLSWVADVGVFPVNKAGVAAVADSEAMQNPNKRWVVDTYLQEFPGGFPGGNWQPLINARTVRIWNQLDPWNWYIQEIQSLLLGQKTPEQLLEEMAVRINGALGTA